NKSATALRLAPLLDQVRSESVTQQMRSFAGHSQADARHGDTDPLREPTTTHRTLVALGAKQCASTALWRSTAQIGRQGLPYFFWQRQMPLASALGSR